MKAMTMMIAFVMMMMVMTLKMMRANNDDDVAVAFDEVQCFSDVLKCAILTL